MSSVDIETMSTSVFGVEPVVDVEMVVNVVSVEPALDPTVEISSEGNQGPPGPAGLIKVTHGDDPDVLRPNVPLVYWVGTVYPANADPDDLLMLKEA